MLRQTRQCSLEARYGRAPGVTMLCSLAGSDQPLNGPLVAPLLVVVCDLVRVRSVGRRQDLGRLAVPDCVDALTLHSRRVLRAGVRAGNGRRCHLSGIDSTTA